jgi:putative hydrolase of HD superfamily
MCLVHDLPECIVGDLTPCDPVTKEEKEEKEKV